MKNKKMWLGMLVVVFAFGIPSAACTQSGGGTFTLTDIPSRFNGMYVKLIASNVMLFDNNVTLIGVQSIDLDSESVILQRIVNGRVSIPLWTRIIDGRTVEFMRYNGNHTVEVEILIFRSAMLNENSCDELAEIYFESVCFSNGSATRSFHDNDGFISWF